MNLARIAGGIINRTKMKWQELCLEVYDNSDKTPVISLSVITHHPPFTVNSTVISYNNRKGDIIVRETDLQNWNTTMSDKVQGPKSWRVSL